MHSTLKLAGLAALLSTAGPTLVHAQDTAARTNIGSASSQDAAFDRFVPKPQRKDVQLDYEFWDEALSYMVMSMGPSTRKGAGRPAPGMGTRRVYGHESRVRLEGNRVAFSFLELDAITPLSEYRADLERIGSEIDIASLSRDEQLAYWINLHNVAVTEQIGLAYPVQSPSRMKIGPEGTPLDTTRFITVAGVAMSPRDIRTRIVFPNWDDPRVMYGFFRGEVGGPSIRRTAYTGKNVMALLDASANEFVNSLRGVEHYGDTLLVSKVYEEAAPFFFTDYEADLRAHLADYAEEDVEQLLAKTDRVKTNQYVDVVADLAAGDREPSYSYIETDSSNGRVAQRTRVAPSIGRLLGERYEKFRELQREGRLGRVIVLPPTGSEPVAEETPSTPDTDDE